MPERMSVEVDAKEDHYRAGEPATFDVDAQYLFGASAAGAKVEATCKVTPEDFTPPGRESYHFGSAEFERQASEESGATQVGSSETTIGEDGAATVSCEQTSLSSRRSAKLRAEVSVLEAGSGRSTDETGEVWLHPARHAVGLRTKVEEVEANEPFRVEGIVADWGGDKVDREDEVEVEIISLDREYGRYRSRYGNDWEIHWREIVTGTKTADVRNGQFSFEVTPSSLEDAFAVRVRAGEASSTLQLDTDRWSYRWRYSNRNDTPQPSTPTAVPVEVSGPIEVGEETDVTFESPYEGRALVAVETHQVLDYTWKSVEAGTNEWSFELDEFVPNAYVSALVIKNPHLESEDSFVPERAFGVTSVDVKPTRHEGTMSLDVPDKTRPRRRMEVGVRADVGGGEAWVTVAAVDEGVLQLTDYASPNPLDELLAQRALGVDTFDTVGWNVRMPGRASSSGGGAAVRARQKAEGGRVMPVEPVALWSGLVKLENGRATVPFELPQYRGKLRVMGVAMGERRVAAAETSVRVRDPLGLKVTAPRFLSNGDRFTVPLFLTNQTGADREVEVTIGSKPLPMPGIREGDEERDLLTFTSATTRSVEIEKGESTTVMFRAEAASASGAVEIRARAKAGDHESRVRTKVPLQPAAPSERKKEAVSLEPGTTDLTEYLEGWVPTSERTTFRVTQTPFAEVLDAVRHLIEYPYGCLEQTVSSTRPLLYMSDLVSSIDPDLSDEYENVDDMAASGIDRTLSLQTPDGGFGYWPGDTEPKGWDSAYAVDMLLDARDNGYQVPDSRIERALSWLERAVRRSEYDDAHPYMHYVLAKAGRADRAAIRSEVQQLSEVEEPGPAVEERRFVAKAALYRAGDRRFKEDLEQLGGARPGSGDLSRDDGGTYYSHLRHFGRALAIHLDLFGREATDESHIINLAERMEREGWLTTQEAMWGVSAIGRWIEEGADKGASDFDGATLRVDGRTVSPAHKSDEGLPTWSVAHAADRDSVSIDANLGGSGNWYVMVSSNGVRKEPTVEFGDSGLAVSRRYVDASGNDISSNDIEVGDLFYVKLSVENPGDDTVENVAIVDRLPAGFEVENPRLSGSPDVVSSLAGDDSFDDAGDTPNWWYDHMNIRDDRVQIFGDVPGESTRDVVYAVRATLGGSFKVPPIEASAMYVPTVWSRHRGGTVDILMPDR